MRRSRVRSPSAPPFSSGRLHRKLDFQDPPDANLSLRAIESKRVPVYPAVDRVVCAHRRRIISLAIRGRYARPGKLFELITRSADPAAGQLDEGLAFDGARCFASMP